MTVAGRRRAIFWLDALGRLGQRGCIGVTLTKDGAGSNCDEGAMIFQGCFFFAAGFCWRAFRWAAMRRFCWAAGRARIFRLWVGVWRR